MENEKESKDMSEEKDNCNGCPTCNDTHLGSAGCFVHGEQYLQDKIKSLESRLSALNDVKWGLESRLKESEEEVFIKCKQNGVLLERLSQAEAENKVLRDENVAYNKNYLKLMDVAEKLSEWVEGYIDYLGHEDCGNECQQGEMRKEMEKLIAEWDGIKKEEK